MSEHILKCQHCGIIYDVEETKRVAGDSPWIYKYCKAYCYTRATMKAKPSTNNPPNNLLDLLREGVRLHKTQRGALWDEYWNDVQAAIAAAGGGETK